MVVRVGRWDLAPASGSLLNKKFWYAPGYATALAGNPRGRRRWERRRREGRQRAEEVHIFCVVKGFELCEYHISSVVREC